MRRKFLIYFLSIFNVWIFQSFAEGDDEKQSHPTLVGSHDFINCDYTRFEGQLEVLKTGNEFLKLRVGMVQLELDKQREQRKSLENKIDEIILHLQSIDNKILMQSRQHLSEVNDLISNQNQWLQTKYQTPAADVNWQMMAEIKEIVTLHDGVLKNHTLALGESISKNLTILQTIKSKLTNIETIAATKTNQIAFNRNVQKYLSNKESPKICFKNENKTLTCTTQLYPSNCADFNENYCSNNKCRIQNNLFGPNPFLVACDDNTEGGGWSVVQRRINGSEDFYRDWSEYKNGFGHIDGEFFIGLDKLHALTTSLQPVELLIQLKDFNDTLKYAKYDDFHIGNETENYKLNKVGEYSGNAGDSFTQHRGNYFTTKDRDNDNDGVNCAEVKKGAWWYNSCMWSNLNGIYYHNTTVTPTGTGICWATFHGYSYSLQHVQISIRPKRV